jgi:hypothetical protein
MNTEIDYEELERVYLRHAGYIQNGLRAVVLHITPLLMPRLVPINEMPALIPDGFLRELYVEHEGAIVNARCLNIASSKAPTLYADIALPISTDPVREEFEELWGIFGMNRDQQKEHFWNSFKDQNEAAKSNP